MIWDNRRWHLAFVAKNRIRYIFIDRWETCCTSVCGTTARASAPNAHGSATASPSETFKLVQGLTSWLTTGSLPRTGTVTWALHTFLSRHYSSLTDLIGASGWQSHPGSKRRRQEKVQLSISDTKDAATQGRASLVQRLYQTTTEQILQGWKGHNLHGAIVSINACQLHVVSNCLHFLSIDMKTWA
jgi:hypothetical protein